jgi:hypothetical protein
MTHRDRPWVASGRKQAAGRSGGDVGHLQGLLTPSDASQGRSLWVIIIKIWYEPHREAAVSQLPVAGADAVGLETPEAAVIGPGEAFQ